jgi:hypothetical protein
LKLVAIAVFLLNLSSFAYYEDLPQVVELANAGDYHLVLDGQACPRRYGPKNEVHQLRGKEGQLCLESLKVPAEVVFEVAQMEGAELENESDYDQRVTSVLSFRSELFKDQRFSLSGLKAFAKAMDIPVRHLENVAVRGEQVRSGSFSMFNDLFVGLEYIDRSEVQKWLYREFSGQSVQIISFGDGVELYPGGGFYVTHYLIVCDDKAVYLKLSWWNS